MTAPHRSLRNVGLGTILLARINLNLPVRMTYFFLPAISRGLGVSISSAGALVSARSLMGITALLFGMLSDHLGGRRIMVLGTVLLVIGAAVTAGLPWYGAALVGFAILGLSKSAFDPAMLAYLGQRVPYDRRGRALGLAELAWSGALLGMPFCGLLIDRFNWRVPFALIAALGLLAWWWLRRALETDESGQRGTSEGLAALFRNLAHILGDPNSRLAISITALLMFAQDNLLVVYGYWMEDRFGLTVATLGVVTLVVGVAELVAELGVAFISDRLGKRRSVFLSLILTGCGYALLPRLTGSLFLALAGTAFLIMSFEFSIVGLIPIVSGLNATARGTLMSLNVAAASAGRAVAAPLAVALYRPGDLTRNGPVSALACLGLLGLLLLLRERDH